jgi:hypothetical protein
MWWIYYKKIAQKQITHLKVIINIIIGSAEFLNTANGG